MIVLWLAAGVLAKTGSTVTKPVGIQGGFDVSIVPPWIQKTRERIEGTNKQKRLQKKAATVAAKAILSDDTDLQSTVNAAFESFVQSLPVVDNRIQSLERASELFASQIADALERMRADEEDFLLMAAVL